MINPDHAIFSQATEASLGGPQALGAERTLAQTETLQLEWERRFEAGEEPEPFAPGGPWE